jgi:L-iditol 2-dehydrogenase
VRVARLHGVGDVRLSDEPVPSPEPGQRLVRVTAVGICGSDLHWYSDGGIGDATLKQPLVVGHEFAGRLEDGTLVAVDPAIPCGGCRECRAGNPNLCGNLFFAGHSTQDGALREYLVWPEHLLHALPDGFSDADGALLEPLGVAIHSMDLAHPRVGMTVGVIGCGPIGLMLIQLARAAGATRVVASDPLPHRREAARRFGADEVWDVGDPAIADSGVDVAFEVAGSDEAVDSALYAARPGARVLLVGIPNSDSTTFGASLARRKGLTLVMVRRMKEVYPRAIELVRRGIVDVSTLVTSTYTLDNVGEALSEAVARKGLKVLVAPNG